MEENRKMNQFLLLKRGLLGGTKCLENNDKYMFHFNSALYLNSFDVTVWLQHTVDGF